MKFIKPTFITNIECNYCCQVDHMRYECYVNKNLSHDMRAMLMVRTCTNTHGYKSYVDG